MTAESLDSVNISKGKLKIVREVGELLIKAINEAGCRDGKVR